MVYNVIYEMISDAELVLVVERKRRENDYCSVEDVCALLRIDPEQYWNAWARVQEEIKKLEEEEDLLEKKKDEEYRKWLRMIEEIRRLWDEEREQEEEDIEEGFTR